MRRGLKIWIRCKQCGIVKPYKLLATLRRPYGRPYCSKKCYEAARTASKQERMAEEFTCAYCGKINERDRNVIRRAKERGTKLYCDHECATKGWEKDHQVETKCPRCGEVYYRRLMDVKHNKKQTCPKCRHKSKKIIYKCEVCGKPVPKTPYWADKWNHYFCCPEHRAQWHSSENNGNWKGGVTKFDNRIYIRDSKLKRYFMRSRLIMAKAMNIDIKDLGGVVHHIDYDKHNDKLENLIWFKDQIAHMKFHDQLEKKLKELAGIIKPVCNQVDAEELLKDFRNKYGPVCIKLKVTDNRAYLYMPDDSNASKEGYISRARWVLGNKLNRPLTPTELPHHLDNNKLNDDPDNLQLCADSSEHMKLHHIIRNQEQEAFMKLGPKILIEETTRALNEIDYSGYSWFREEQKVQPKPTHAFAIV